MRAGIMRIYNSTHASRYRELMCAVSSNLDDEGASPCRVPAFPDISIHQKNIELL